MSKIKIYFPLEVDEDGWPPVSGESLWATDIGSNHAVIDNIPFFIPLISLGDTIEYEKVDDYYLYKKTVVSSQNSTVRIMFNISNIQNIISQLEKLGASIESGKDFKNLTALSINSKKSYTDIVDFLSLAEQDNILSFEESAVCDTHRAVSKK